MIAENERKATEVCGRGCLRIVERISMEDREATRQRLSEAAEVLQRKYLLSVPETNRFLHELLDVAV